MGANRAHVRGHQLIAALGHHRHLLMGPLRGGPQAKEPCANGVRNVLNLAQVLVSLITGLVNGFERRAG